MSKYPAFKLTYFNMRGRGEPLRIAFSIAGIPFEDNRLEVVDYYSTHKQTMLVGTIPELLIDGKPYGQSGAILRYIGKLGNMYPADQLKALAVDQILAQIEDIMAPITKMLMDQNPESKKEQFEFLVGTKLPYMVPKVEACLKAYSGSHAVGDDLTIADVLVYTFVELIKSKECGDFGENLVNQHPHMIRIYEQIKKHPKVVEWKKTHQ